MSASSAVAELMISSEAFESNGKIPSRFTCDGVNHNPPLYITGIPEQAVSLALIVDDPDARPKAWVHWLVWNIPVTGKIAENSVPGTEGTNDFRRTGYGGPCPPTGTHHYHFKIFALDKMLGLKEGAGILDLEKEMKNHIIARGELVAKYQRTIR